MNDSEFMKDESTECTHLRKDSQYPHEGNQVKSALVIKKIVPARKSDGVISHHSQDPLGKLPFTATVYQSPTSSPLNFSTGFSNCTQRKSFQAADPKEKF